MNEAAHGGEACQIDVAGYRACRNSWCPTLVLAEVAERTDGLCTECFRGQLGAKVAAVEIRNKGRILSMQRTRGRARAGSKGNRATKTSAENAKRNAMRRLRDLFPELYQLLLGEERARLGLEPFPLETAVHEPTDASLTIEFARVYDALDQHGVDLDGLEVPERQ